MKIDVHAVRLPVRSRDRCVDRLVRFVAGALLLVALPAAAAGAARGNDFPTQARVEFVLDCMQSSNLPQHEAMYKCSCAIDAIARKVDYATWVDLGTVANATTIAGERGGVLRDMKDGRKLIKSYRELQAEAKKGCFLNE